MKKKESFGEYKFTPIGWLESCYTAKFGTPRQSGLSRAAIAKLRLRADLQPEQSLQGIEGFSHLWLVWVFHKNEVSRYHSKVHPPRLGGRSVGLFASRTPHRPNPIGLSLVELVSIDKGVLHLRGTDLIDGTPILDIKPYLPEIEARPNAEAGWVDNHDIEKICVNFLPEVESKLETSNVADLRALIVESIQMDPRPLIYRNDSESEEPRYRNTHVFQLWDYDIHFKFESSGQAVVFNLTKGYSLRGSLTEPR